MRLPAAMVFLATLGCAEDGWTEAPVAPSAEALAYTGPNRAFRGSCGGSSLDVWMTSHEATGCATLDDTVLFGTETGNPELTGGSPVASATCSTSAGDPHVILKGPIVLMGTETGNPELVSTSGGPIALYATPSSAPVMISGGRATVRTYATATEYIILLARAQGGAMNGVACGVGGIGSTCSLPFDPGASKADVCAP
ncbi:MAG: hypothetical protein AAF602_20025 [Myxococcota bacterium]